MVERLFLRRDDHPACGPQTTVPASTLREYAAPLALQNHVAHVTAYEEVLRDGVQVLERVLPDGAIRLILDSRIGLPSLLDFLLYAESSRRIIFRFPLFFSFSK